MSKHAVETSIRDMFRVAPGHEVLAGIRSDATTGTSKKEGLEALPGDLDVLAGLQERLWAEHTRSVLLVLQGMDSSGKDGTIKHVIGALNPSSMHIVSFKQPTEEELEHDFLWRIHRALPGPGQVGIFNRSHYEDVVVVRVKHLVPEEIWAPRYTIIKEFEKELVDSGTKLVKVFLHISYDEQRERLLERLRNPDKRWKFSENDVEERGRWSKYQGAYDAALDHCSTDFAPWYAVPADHKWYRNWAVTQLLIETLQEMDPQYPRPDLDVEGLEARLAPPG